MRSLDALEVTSQHGDAQSVCTDTHHGSRYPRESSRLQGEMTARCAARDWSDVTKIASSHVGDTLQLCGIDGSSPGGVSLTGFLVWYASLEVSGLGALHASRTSRFRTLGYTSNRG